MTSEVAKQIRKATRQSVIWTNSRHTFDVAEMRFRIGLPARPMNEHLRMGHIESYNRAVETLCRDCDSRPPPDVKTCPRKVKIFGRAADP